MTLVGVISDTHGRLSAAAYAALAECDVIIHAGDIGGPGILRELKTLAPVHAVLGNNDYDEHGSDVQWFARPIVDGVKFLVAHYPRDVQFTGLGCPGVKAGEPIPDVCIHGHTHIPRLDFGDAARPASYIVNPGSASRPRGGFERSVAKIGIENGHVTFICVETLDGDPVLTCGDAPLSL